MSPNDSGNSGVDTFANNAFREIAQYAWVRPTRTTFIQNIVRRSMMTRSRSTVLLGIARLHMYTYI